MTIAPIPAIANGRCRNLMVYTGYGCVCVCASGAAATHRYALAGWAVYPPCAGAEVAQTQRLHARVRVLGDWYLCYGLSPWSSSADLFSSTKKRGR